MRNFPPLLCLIMLALIITSCGTRKVEKDRKQEKVSVLEHKDVKTSEKITADVSTISFKETENIVFTPLDPSKPSQVIKGKDTLTFINSKVEVNNSKASETKTDKTVSENNSSDQSKTEIEIKNEESSRSSESKRSNTGLIWGIILAVLAIGIIWYFKKQLPFL